MKIELTDDLMTIITKMSEGNPGCLHFLFEVLGISSEDLFDIALRLDSAELYGSLIYMLWNDCCDRDVAKTVRMIRNLDRDTLRSYVVDKGRGTKYEDR